jgi:RHS repeat-associated protein
MATVLHERPRNRLRRPFRTPGNDLPRSAKAISGLRYYSPNLGRWTNRDPAEEEGGAALYGFADDAPLDHIDPLGDTVACSAGIRYRVGIAPLDAFQADAGYSKTADKRRDYNNTGRNATYGLLIPPFSTSGPGTIVNTASLTWPGKVNVPVGAFEITYFLFFVDFDVGCLRDDAKLSIKISETKIKETRCVFSGSTSTPKCVTAGLPNQFSEWPLTTTASGCGVMLSKRKVPSSECTHTAIFADTPQIYQYHRPFGKVQRGFYINARHHKVELKEGLRTLSSIEHDFSVGRDKDGNLVAAP